MSQVVESALKPEPSEPEDSMRLVFYMLGSVEEHKVALANLKAACEELLPGSYSVEVVDIEADPLLAVRQGILATPMAQRVHPRPVRRAVGSFRDARSLAEVLEFPSDHSSNSSPGR
ncbi:MAG: circadian clock protein KaiB [Actinobacteria bacterium]|nr:circadian clock protein KaiB [Actinomycetota bacterium]